jgi:YHS domain-containing protein
MSIMIMLVAAVALQTPQFVCPVMGDAIDVKSAPEFFYKDVVYSICCAGCKGALLKDTDRVLAKEHKGLIGISVFDPVSQSAIKPSKAEGYSDYKSVRYYFRDAENKAKFDAYPAAYTKKPAYASNTACAVTKEAFEPNEAWGYSDIEMSIEGKKEIVRAYFCCAGCKPKFDKEPAKFLANLTPKKQAVVEVNKD